MLNEGGQLKELGTVTIPGSRAFEFKIADDTVKQLVRGEAATMKMVATPDGTKVTILGPDTAALLDTETLSRVEETFREIQLTCNLH